MHGQQNIKKVICNLIPLHAQKSFYISVPTTINTPQRSISLRILGLNWRIIFEKMLAVYHQPALNSTFILYYSC